MKFWETEVRFAPEPDEPSEPDAEAMISALTRERDEARAALALAYPRALQAAAHIAERMADTRAHAGLAYSSCVRIAEDILALAPDDIERIAEEHEHG